MRAEAPSNGLAARLIGEGLVLAALAGWWLAARGLPEFVLPGPLVTGERLLDLFVTPEFLQHTLASSWRVVAAVMLSLLIGGGLAFAAEAAPWLDIVVNERIKPVLNSFPSIGWAILAAIWF
ncbi:MAG TPA: ABC transporter permease, partial [Alphaproteobacteria bacterium]|nr:ABC transporter permease [Alphaproteobacteria bacterium]